MLAVALSYVLGRRVATGSRELTHALRGLADSPYAWFLSARCGKRKVLGAGGDHRAGHLADRDAGELGPLT